MMKAKGIIIRSGITDNIFNRILEGPVDLFSSDFIISRISSLDTAQSKKLFEFYFSET